MPGLLASPMTQGLLNRPYARQQGVGWMNVGGGGPGGGGQGQPSPYDPGAQIWRQLFQGLSQQGLGALAPSNAGKVFSPELRAMLGPEYQPQKKGGK